MGTSSLLRTVGSGGRRGRATCLVYTVGHRAVAHTYSKTIASVFQAGGHGPTGYERLPPGTRTAPHKENMKKLTR